MRILRSANILYPAVKTDFHYLSSNLFRLRGFKSLCYLCSLWFQVQRSKDIFFLISTKSGGAVSRRLQRFVSTRLSLQYGAGLTQTWSKYNSITILNREKGYILRHLLTNTANHCNSPVELGAHVLSQLQFRKCCINTS